MKIYLMLILISFKLSLVGCGHVKVKPVELCGKLELGGQCAYFPKGPTRKETEQQYQDSLFPSFRISVEHWGYLKTAILQLCNQYDKCSFEDLNEKILSFEKSLGEPYENKLR